MTYTTKCGIEFFPTEKEAMARFIARLHRDGFGGNTYTCLLEDNSKHWHAITSAATKPAPIHTGTGCDGHWAEVRGTSVIFHAGDAGTINEGFFQ